MQNPKGVMKGSSPPAPNFEEVYHQLAFYFSPENLKNDQFLMSKMNPKGHWVELKVILEFKRMKQLLSHVQEMYRARFISTALQMAKAHEVPKVELSSDERRIRPFPLTRKIRAQIEYYFAPERYSQDVFMQLVSEENKGVIPLERIVSFNAMRKLLPADKSPAEIRALIIHSLKASLNVTYENDGVRPKTLFEKIVAAVEKIFAKNNIQKNAELQETLSESAGFIPIARIMQFIKPLCFNQPEAVAKVIQKHSKILEVSETLDQVKLKVSEYDLKRNSPSMLHNENPMMPKNQMENLNPQPLLKRSGHITFEDENMPFEYEVGRSNLKKSGQLENAPLSSGSSLRRSGQLENSPLPEPEYFNQAPSSVQNVSSGSITFEDEKMGLEFSSGKVENSKSQVVSVSPSVKPVASLLSTIPKVTWEWTQPKQTSLFSLVTYNILGKSLATYHSDYCDPKYLDWKYRMPLILRDISAIKSDIICLQELESTANNLPTDCAPQLFAELNKQGFTGVHQIKISAKGKPLHREQLGNAVLWNTKVFKLIKKTIFGFAEALDPILPDPASTAHFGKPHLAMIVELEHLKVPNTKIIVATTHLACVPGNPEIQLAQLCVLIAKLEQLSRGKIPVILAGDFNTTPFQQGSQPPVYEYLSTGKVSSSHPQLQSGKNVGISYPKIIDPTSGTISHDIKLTSAYCALQGHEPEITNKKPNFENCLDYIWTSGLQVSSVLKLPDIASVTENDGIPSSKLPSDHFPIGASFYL